MDSFNLIKKILTSDNWNSYWILKKRNYDNGYQKFEGDIVLVTLPYLKVERKEEEILLKEFEQVANTEILCNIFINEKFPPFQRGQYLYEFIDGFSLKDIDVYKYLEDAFKIESKSLWDYKELYNKMKDGQNNN